jgi:two-component system sensor histidine kinase KdpD
VARELSQDLVLVANGRPLAAHERRLFNAFAAQLSAAIERRALANRADRVTALAEADELRSALLQAVSHDLRTPLASIKASASSLRQHDIDWTPAEEAEFLRTIEHETDRLTTLVTNLLDMSRIQAGAIAVHRTPVGLEEVVPAALAAVGDRRSIVRLDLPHTLPEVETDPVLLERVVANLVDNAIAHSPAGTEVRVEAGQVGERVDLRIIDQGPGIPRADRDRLFEPFQRSGDSTRPAGAGVGLGLAVARGFARAIGAELLVDDTPGGGTTMVIELEASR